MFNAIIIVFNINDRLSFNDVLYEWWPLVEHLKGNTVHCILVGTQCDQPDRRQVTRIEAQEFAKEHRMPYYEVSAKTSENINEMFQSVITTLHNMQSEK